MLQSKSNLKSTVVFQRSLVLAFIGIGLWVTHTSFSDETEDAPQLLRIESVFGLMANQIVDTACNAPEFRACFDVPFAECSRELRAMLSECREQLEMDIPDLVAADEVDPIIEKTYQCVIPKWDELIEDRRIESKECAELEQNATERSP